MEKTSTDLPIDMLVEIAMCTSTSYDIVNLCKANELLAYKCKDNAPFWKTWMHRHNPEVFIVLDYRRKIVYDQLYLTQDGADNNIRDIFATDIRGYTDNYVLDHLSIIEFQPILNKKVFYLCIRQYTPEKWKLKTNNEVVGVYCENEISKNVDKLCKLCGSRNYFFIIKINMNDFTIGEFTTISPKEVTNTLWKTIEIYG